MDGEAHAIFGDVNIHATNLAFLENANPTERRQLLLRGLYFEQMNSRKVQIDARASSPEYVAWVWKTNFLGCLEGLDPFYWITGKPGSGKSTLMTHVSSSSRTRDALARNGKRWKIVRFFFDFRVGTSLANNIEGLVRSLLYQVIKQMPEVANVLDHHEFNVPMTAWTLERCLDALREATESSSYNICAFIDGLDEFDGLYSRLIEVLYTIKENVSGLKLCLASRPYLAFKESFQEFSTLTMQDHNFESIDLYVSAQWSSHRIDHNAQLPKDLCKRIRDKANGVFLWARLAVDELLVDLLGHKAVSELHAQLDSMPAEVGDMYQRSLQRLSEPHQQEASAVLYVLLQTDGKLPINKLYATVAAMHRWGHIGQAVLPIDCTADNSQRLFAILGDLTDQVPSDLYDSQEFKADDSRLIPPRLDFENGTVICKYDRTQCVVMTHETLRAFLVNSLWLTSRIGERYDFEEDSSPRFWSNIYLTELSSKVLAKPRDLALETQICCSAKAYIERLRVLDSSEKWNSVKGYIEDLLATLRL